VQQPAAGYQAPAGFRAPAGPQAPRSSGGPQMPPRPSGPRTPRHPSEPAGATRSAGYPGGPARSAGYPGAGYPDLDDDDDFDSDLDRRGSHATGYGQNFSWVLGWTILGALIPGTGLIAAGRRRAGILLISLLGVVLVALALLALGGGLQDRAVGLAVDSKALMILAIAAPTIGLAWAAVILLTSAQLRRYASLDTAQKAFGGVVVLALIGGVALPAYKVTDYAMITRSIVTSDSVFRGDSETGSGGGPNAAKADPWADKPQMNVLLIGSDAGADRAGIRPDTLILASINTKTGKTVMFSLPRSLQHAAFADGSPGKEAYPDGYYCPNAAPGAECLINAIWRWAEGDGKQYYSKFKNPGLRATADAVSGTLGIKVDTYVMLNLNGFQDFVDALDGVTVDVHERLPIGGNSNYHVATGGYIEKGDNQHLDGYHALWFARSRWSTSDYDRMQRQRCVIGAVVDQSDPLKVARNFPSLAKALKKNLATGIDSSDLSAWVTLAQRIQKGGVKSVVFDPNVINTVDPDIDAIHKLVQTAVKSTAKVKKPSTAATPGAGATPSATPSKSTTNPPKTAKPGSAQSIASVC
jgi:LCP family protein required for cell wall assembly